MLTKIEYTAGRKKQGGVWYKSSVRRKFYFVSILFFMGHVTKIHVID